MRARGAGRGMVIAGGCGDLPPVSNVRIAAKFESLRATAFLEGLDSGNASDAARELFQNRRISRRNQLTIFACYSRSAASSAPCVCMDESKVIYENVRA
jgi:hypothetical protein